MQKIEFVITEGIEACANHYCHAGTRTRDDVYNAPFTLDMTEVAPDVDLVIVDIYTASSVPFAQLTQPKLEIKANGGTLRTYDLRTIEESCLISVYVWRKPAGPWLVRFAFIDPHDFDGAEVGAGAQS